MLPETRLPSSLIVIAAAIVAGLLFLCRFAKSKEAANDMLVEYRKLLADARKEKAIELEAAKKEADEIAEAAPLHPPS